MVGYAFVASVAGQALAAILAGQDLAAIDRCSLLSRRSSVFDLGADDKSRFWPTYLPPTVASACSERSVSRLFLPRHDQELRSVAIAR